MSRYLNWLHRDEKPEEQRELTRKEKISNWWDYHLLHVIIAVAGVLMAGSFLWKALGIGTVKPDCQVAYVGTNALPEDTVAALEAGLSSIGGDFNGDGQAVVQLHQYILPDTAANPAAMAYDYAAESRLLSDLESCDSYFFLLEDPAAFQARYFSLALLDGSLPEANDASAEGTWLRWGDCPVLAALPLGPYSETAADTVSEGDSQALLENIAVARRGFWPGSKTTKYPEACGALWDAMTEGTAS